MKKVLRVVGIILAIIIVIIAGLIVFVKTALPNVGKAPDIKIELTQKRIERGKYLASHVSGCKACHSQRDWTVYSAPAKDGTFGMGGESFDKNEGLPGILYSKNLTPYALHDWTDGEILRALTEGESKNGDALFPLMPYQTFATMDREDLYSIIAFIRTLAPIKNEIPARKLDFPLNIIVNTIPAKANLDNKPDSNNSLQYGQYLANIANCRECHTQFKDGKLVEGTDFTGGRRFGFANGTAAYTANITPDKNTGIGNWTKELFIQKFKQYADSSYKPKPVGQKEYNTIMPWTEFSGMTVKDLGAIYDYLSSLKPVDHKVIKFASK